MGDGLGGKGSFHIDESKVYIVRRKPDGHLYKIFHDGKEERIEPETEAKEK